MTMPGVRELSVLTFRSFEKGEGKQRKLGRAQFVLGFQARLSECMKNGEKSAKR